MVSKEPMVLLYIFQEGLANGLKRHARPSKQPMVLLYMVQEGLTNGFNTMCPKQTMVLGGPCTWF